MFENKKEATLIDHTIKTTLTNSRNLEPSS